jgi:hypothetical protein
MARAPQVDPIAGRAAVTTVLRSLDAGGTGAIDEEALSLAVRHFAGVLRERAPGHSVEVRVPGPAGTAFQCGEGPQHTRGTPPNVVETDAVTFVELCAGRVDWSAAVAAGDVRASGSRADLSELLPVIS